MVSDNIFDISNYMKIYLAEKEKLNINEKELAETLKKIFSQKYNTVCMDIDKTITNCNDIDKEMLDLIFKILKQGKNMCFVTGRGRKMAKSTLNKIYSEAIKRNVDFKNITCSTGNGAIYMYSKEGFLDKEESIISAEKVGKYYREKEVLRELYIKQLTKEGVINIDSAILRKRSIESSGNMSLRFPISRDEYINDKYMMEILNQILLKYDLVDEYYTSKGIFDDKNIFEISLANKKMAIDYLSDRLEENTNQIVRLGDQGRRYGNDFEMLNCFQGFSVDEIEKSTTGVLPVMGKDNNRIKGVKATKQILNELIIE